ncbi:hypothetical protein KIH41_17360 [Litoribacter ruber]|uniref:hypothetical protein n=1 Tax=Litoribacter ruber TaxID=702568 RepID=UPI001BD97F65|nr:hypothetical protein [Litoribacter ruber]MBT0813060.1 hypothetical protein [Litoribacter ruber]
MRFFSRRFRRVAALFCATLMLGQTLAPTAAYALTSGPSQPEVSSFEPIGMTEMVDPFTGDFTYNIPLFELPGPNGGYPFNLSYHAGIGMDDEASWVGLGWNLTAGAITRNVRGLPDEFKGDAIETKLDMNPSVTYGVEAGLTVELFGKEIAKNTDGAPSEQTVDSLKVNVGLGVGLKYNNYNGLGYSISPDVGYYNTINGDIGQDRGNLSLRLDPESGGTINSQVNFPSKIGNVGLNGQYNSKAGLIHLGGRLQTHKGHRVYRDTYAHPTYTPYSSPAYETSSFSASVRGGISIFGIYPNAMLSGFYTQTSLRDRGRVVSTPAVGYMNFENSNYANYLLDFNREKEGILSKDHPNLAIPIPTYDQYIVSGQGISGNYRAFRNDRVMVSDAPASSDKSASFGGGLDLGGKKLGVNATLNFNSSYVSPWVENNNSAANYLPTSTQKNSTYESWYFRKTGEPHAESLQSYNAIGNAGAVRTRLAGNMALSTLEDDSWNGTTPRNTRENERKERNELLVPHTNEEILIDGKPVLDEYKIFIQNQNGETVEYNRSNLPGHHITGFVAVSGDGLRYNFTLPAYNHTKEEITYSTNSNNGIFTYPTGEENGDPNYKFNGTHQMINSVKTPGFAYAYLLTSITGPDYVDVNNDGITDDDIGYWVKFTYQQSASASDPYHWRDPFVGAHFLEGFKADPRDDKGSFTYGTKDVYYLARAETKSHLAIFDLRDRKDARGAYSKLQNGNQTTGKRLKGLKSVSLYTKAGFPNHPIKKVNFEYDYSLCQGVPNYGASTGSNEITGANEGGKLTLKKVFFTYGSSQRGELNPYEFSYQQNPDYDELAYDRWGNYSPKRLDDPFYNRDIPYVEQSPDQRQALNDNAAAWSLSEIKLPSGASMMVDYEIDDYAYVQHKEAMYMAQLVDAKGGAPTQLNQNFTVENDPKVRFRLKHTKSSSLNEEEQKAELLKYLDVEDGQIFFKIYSNLRDHTKESLFEFVEGYADLDLAKGYGLETGSSGEFEFGYFYLKNEATHSNNNHQGYNPLMLRAWQHIEADQPHLMNLTRPLTETGSRTAQLNQIKSLPSLLPAISSVFGRVYRFCYNKNWGQQLDPSRSMVKLKSPDKIKFGGGIRVRQLTMSDGWGQQGSGVYGKVYEYTQEENGNVISSGVAAYEPFVGGEENALRYAKKFTRSVKLKADENLFFEYPINESLYPGPQVGYAVVKEWSLPAAYVAGLDVKHIASSGTNYFPTNGNTSIGTSGMKLHEFYTARDYPVRTFESSKQTNPFFNQTNLSILGQYVSEGISSSQGYSIITNDMHGKLKSQKSFRQANDGSIHADPYQWTSHKYLSEEIYYEGKKANALVNTLGQDEEGHLIVPNDANEASQSFGLTVDFISDMSEKRSNTWQGGADADIDLLIALFFPAIIATVWPKISKTEHTFRTAVNNKIINQSGILLAVENYDEGSLISSENVSWDAQTGEPVLVRVNNNYDEPIYNYNFLAYKEYAGMDGAYKNSKFTFDMGIPTQHPTVADWKQVRIPGYSGQVVREGDEIVIYRQDGENSEIVTQAVVVKQESFNFIVHPRDPLPAEANLYATVMRSGYRNQLKASAGSITSLEPPFTGDSVNYEYTVNRPVGVQLR